MIADKEKEGAAMILEILRKRKKVLILLGLLLIALAVFPGGKRIRYMLVDLTFSWTERTAAELQVKAFAEEQGLYFAQYPQSLIQLLERNPETEEFVLNYPLRQELEPDVSGFGREEVPLFLQWDPRWGYEQYGSDFLAVTGCGPTCLAMAGYYLTGSEEMNPRDVAAFAQKEGYYAKGYGSSWTLISQGSGQLGLTATELPLVKGKMTAALERGNPVILAMGAGDFTTTGHYIVLTGLEEGLFRVADPNSIRNSGQLWSYEQLEGQIRNIWEISA